MVRRDLEISFTAGKLAYRHRQGIGFKEPLARALGIKPKTPLHILDATAGLGRDAFVMASLGCIVTLLERSKPVFEALSQALEKASYDEKCSAIIARMKLLNANSIDYLNTFQKWQQEEKVDVIYLDPMYPASSKSALVKKEMRDLREIVGDDPDVDLLFEAAMQAPVRRVVVKRHRHAPYIKGIKPSHSIMTKVLRFDVYTALPKQVT